jgi:ferritin-like metal-binding protein YciE
MSIGSLKELYLDELGDLYDVETQMIRALARLAEAAHAPELREALARHRDESRLHLERLQLIFTHWGERVAAGRSVGIAGIVQEADDRVHDAATPDVRDAAIVGAAQRIEHYEIAAYGCARAYARRLNRADEARLLQETLDEEGRADRRLTEIAEAHVNDDARAEADLHERRAPAPLRYIGPDRLDIRRLAGSGSLEVTNAQDEALGHFDGLVIDPAGRPRYVVVHARGVFTGRRYLVPVPHVQFDDRARLLRVDLDKAVAGRYPAFDPDEFRTMSDAEWSGYEREVAAFFPPFRPSGSEPSAGISDALPEWLLTGVWMTAPPEQVNRLPEEARTYVNEFEPDDGSARQDDERLVAHATPEKEDDAPPHGDKLRG